MDRRHLLHTAAAAVGAAVSPARGAHPLSVLVIGAGVAGLACAQALALRRHAVTVLEARPDRIGGRLWTSDRWSTRPDDPDTVRLGLPLDLGASWIHGVHRNPIQALAEEIQATCVTTSYERSVLFGSDGQPLSVAQARRLQGLHQAMDAAIRAGQRAGRDAALYDTLWTGTRASRMTAADQALLRFAMSARYETEYGASVSGLGQGADRQRSGRLKELSTWWFDDTGQDRLKISGEDRLFARGYGQIAEHLARGLDIRLGEEVRQIEHGGPQVQVTTRLGRHRADRVVVTVPLGVLQAGALAFAPALPAGHASAIGQIGMGVLDKLYLKFDRAFWVDRLPGAADAHWIESIPAVTDPMQTWTEWVNFQSVLGLPVLMGLNAADAAVALEDRSDQALIDSAMDRLKLIYGHRIPAPTAFMRTRWGQDPYTRGSYSFNALGMARDARATLASPVGHSLFFAGEATDADYPGTVHGAYLSGRDAAARVIASA